MSKIKSFDYSRGITFIGFFLIFSGILILLNELNVPWISYTLIPFSLIISLLFKKKEELFYPLIFNTVFFSVYVSYLFPTEWLFWLNGLFLVVLIFLNTEPVVPDKLYSGVLGAIFLGFFSSLYSYLGFIDGLFYTTSTLPVSFSLLFIACFFLLLLFTWAVPTKLGQFFGILSAFGFLLTLTNISLFGDSLFGVFVFIGYVLYFFVYFFCHIAENNRFSLSLPILIFGFISLPDILVLSSSAIVRLIPLFVAILIVLFLAAYSFANCRTAEKRISFDISILILISHIITTILDSSSISYILSSFIFAIYLIIIYKMKEKHAPYLTTWLTAMSIVVPIKIVFIDFKALDISLAYESLFAIVLGASIAFFNISKNNKKKFESHDE